MICADYMAGVAPTIEATAEEVPASDRPLAEVMADENPQAVEAPTDEE